jgi:bifunctional DNA primase/polymerase-like protein
VQHDLVSQLLELFGPDTVLLPIPRGCKGPKIKGWQHFTSEKMKQPEYLAELNHDGNIGVLLRNGLITIDVDDDEAVEPFLSLNPKLRRRLDRGAFAAAMFGCKSKGLIQSPAGSRPNPVKIGVSYAQTVIRP